MSRGGKPISRLRSKRSTANSGKTVGKRGRLENLKPWKPGQSGNLAGRPRTKIFRDIAREIVEMVDSKKKKQRARVLMDALFTQAEKGSLGHFKEIHRLLEEDSTSAQARIELTAASNTEHWGTPKAKLSLEETLRQIRFIYGLSDDLHADPGPRLTTQNRATCIEAVAAAREQLTADPLSPEVQQNTHP